MTNADEHRLSGPPNAGDETATLLGGLERQRATFAWKVSALDQAALASRIGASELTLGGLIKHLAFVEDLKLSTMLLGQDLAAPWNTVDWVHDPTWPRYSATEDRPESLYCLWHDAVGRSRATTVTSSVVTPALARSKS